MPIISGGNIIEGSGFAGLLQSAGVPGAGTDCIQTITIGGTPTGGTFRLSYEGFWTAAITWTATDATLVSNIDAALALLPSVASASNVTTAAGTVTSGIGTITVTFVAALGKRVCPVMGVSSALTGTAPTLACAITTAGVGAFGRGNPKGALAIDTTNGKLYQNSGTDTAPTWGLVGSQT